MVRVHVQVPAMSSGSRERCHSGSQPRTPTELCARSVESRGLVLVLVVRIFCEENGASSCALASLNAISSQEPVRALGANCLSLRDKCRCAPVLQVCLRFATVHVAHVVGTTHEQGASGVKVTGGGRRRCLHRHNNSSQQRRSPPPRPSRTSDELDSSTQHRLKIAGIQCAHPSSSSSRRLSSGERQM